MDAEQLLDDARAGGYFEPLAVVVGYVRAMIGGSDPAEALLDYVAPHTVAPVLENTYLATLVLINEDMWPKLPPLTLNPRLMYFQFNVDSTPALGMALVRIPELHDPPGTDFDHWRIVWVGHPDEFRDYLTEWTGEPAS